MDNRGEQRKRLYRNECYGHSFDLWITESAQRLDHTDETNVEKKVNLQKATKEMLERVVMRGYVENEAEKNLIATAAELCKLLFNRATAGEWAKQAQALQSEMGLFLPPLTETIFQWMKEGKESIIEDIKVLAMKSGK